MVGRANYRDVLVAREVPVEGGTSYLKQFRYLCRFVAGREELASTIQLFRGQNRFATTAGPAPRTRRCKACDCPFLDKFALHFSH